jgi:ATP-dependent DNA helicase Rep
MAQDDHERSIALIMQRYEERLTAYQSVDFDDLIGMPMRLLRGHPEVREKWQRILGHVLVDEYQDTNATQYELLKLLVGERAHFTAVGDDDQSIYGWRGATLDNLKKLPVDYPQLKVIKLEQNYRSTSAILRAANNVIGPNPKLFPKTCSRNWARASRCAWSTATPKSTRPSAPWPASRACAPRTRSRRGRTSPSSTAPTTRPSPSRRRCARPTSPTRSRAAPAFSTAPRSRTCAPGSACGSTTTTTRPSCAPSPRPSAASATPRWASWANSPAAQARMFGALFSPCWKPCCRRRIESLHEFGRYINDLEYRARHTLGAEARAF